METGALLVAFQEFEPAARLVSIVYAGGRLLPLKPRSFLNFAVLRLEVGLSQGAT
jgi:hypothetical protein